MTDYEDEETVAMAKLWDDLVAEFATTGKTYEQDPAWFADWLFLKYFELYQDYERVRDFLS